MIVGVKLLDGSLTQVNLDDKIAEAPASLRLQHGTKVISVVLVTRPVTLGFSQWYEETV